MRYVLLAMLAVTTDNVQEGEEEAVKPEPVKSKSVCAKFLSCM